MSAALINPAAQEFLDGLEVTEREMTEGEAMAFFPLRNVPHSRGEKVLPLTAPPPSEWRLT